MKPESDINLLVPAFREKLEATLKALVWQGYKPHVHETLRSPERSAMLVAKGASKAIPGKSLHCYGCAADVICGEHGYQCARNHCKFYDALRACGEDNGLTSGSNWDGDDKPLEQGENDLVHLQAVPATPRMQDKIRAMAPEHVDTFLRSYYAGLVK